MAQPMVMAVREIFISDLSLVKPIDYVAIYAIECHVLESPQKTMRASRLLSIQMLLETRGRMSARALAQSLEISERTLYRDVDQLAASGVPIYAERGRAGGFQLMDGWKTTLTGLTPAEAQAVFMTGLAQPAAQLGLGAQVEGARLKLLTALPASWRDDAQRISSRFHLDPVDWYRQSELVPHLSVVAEAVWNQQEIAMRYESWTHRVERVVGPLGLVLKAGIWYLVAAIGSEPRTYRISSIQSVTVQESRVKRPRNFQLGAYWERSIERFENELYTGHARLLATPAGLKSLRHLSSAVARAIDHAPDLQPVEGRIEVTIPIESMRNATAQLLRLSPEIEVVDPPELRRMIVERLLEIGTLYGLHTTSATGKVRRKRSESSRKVSARD
jgi:predicted DNA-binding transcriptional regulator YafY